MWKCEESNDSLLDYDIVYRILLYGGNLTTFADDTCKGKRGK